MSCVGISAEQKYLSFCPFHDRSGQCKEKSLSCPDAHLWSECRIVLDFDIPSSSWLNILNKLSHRKKRKQTKYLSMIFGDGLACNSFMFYSFLLVMTKRFLPDKRLEKLLRYFLKMYEISNNFFMDLNRFTNNKSEICCTSLRSCITAIVHQVV